MASQDYESQMKRNKVQFDVLELGLVDLATKFLHVLEVGLVPPPARCRQQTVLQSIKGDCDGVIGVSEVEAVP